VLATSPFIAFVPVTDMDVARTFYGSTLGLPVLEESPFALVVSARGTPSGDLVAWFPDPFGNTLSLTSFQVS
jgi:catechol 2,3-dioxygenase-like lactoylglutathione lyase family enzyme